MAANTAGRRSVATAGRVNADGTLWDDAAKATPQRPRHATAAPNARRIAISVAATQRRYRRLHRFVGETEPTYNPVVKRFALTHRFSGSRSRKKVADEPALDTSEKRAELLKQIAAGVNRPGPPS